MLFHQLTSVRTENVKKKKNEQRRLLITLFWLDAADTCLAFMKSSNSLHVLLPSFRCWMMVSYPAVLVISAPYQQYEEQPLAWIMAGTQAASAPCNRIFWACQKFVFFITVCEQLRGSERDYGGSVLPLINSCGHMFHKWIFKWSSSHSHT